MWCRLQQYQRIDRHWTDSLAQPYDTCNDFAVSVKISRDFHCAVDRAKKELAREKPAKRRRLHSQTDPLDPVSWLTGLGEIFDDVRRFSPETSEDGERRAKCAAQLGRVAQGLLSLRADESADEADLADIPDDALDAAIAAQSDGKVVAFER
jgi:hypothetical protein